jgi:hypothetical protein
MATILLDAFQMFSKVQGPAVKMEKADALMDIDAATEWFARRQIHEHTLWHSQHRVTSLFQSGQAFWSTSMVCEFSAMGLHCRRSLRITLQLAQWILLLSPDRSEWQ